MLPSRPLDLGGIISESIRIIKRCYWRSAIVLLAFWLPGLLLIQFSINKATSTGEEIAEKFSAVSAETPVLLRDCLFIEDMTDPSVYYLRFEYPSLFNVI